VPVSAVPPLTAVLNIPRSTGLAPEVVTAELLAAAKAALPEAFREDGPLGEAGSEAGHHIAPGVGGPDMT